jgi:cytochrome o ubiquinol oxidase operon protein cyoD
MSEHHNHSAHHDDHGNHAGHGHHAQDDHADHGSLKSYAIGFLLSVILTAIPFWLVMDNVIAKPKIAAMVLLVFAAIQIVVHMIYFLHMNTHSEGGWSMLALIFTVVLVVIVLSGSIWVMYHLNYNMMPGMAPGTSQQMHEMS